MSAGAAEALGLVPLLRAGAEHAAQALADLLGGDPRTGPLFEPDARALRAYETGVAFEVGGALVGSVAVLFPAELREGMLVALGSRAAADPASALAEVANIVASHAVSAIADALGARVTLSIPQLSERGSGLALARALGAREPVRASEVGAGRVGGCALLVFLPGGPTRSAIP